MNLTMLSSRFLLLIIGLSSAFSTSGKGIEFEYNDGWSISSRLLVLKDESIVFSSSKDAVIWMKNGIKKYEFKLEDPQSPTLLSDETVVVGTYTGIIYWLKDGKELFRYNVKEWINNNPAVLFDGTVAISTQEGSVLLLKSGKLIWKYRSSERGYSEPTLLPDKSVVVGHFGNNSFDWIKNGNLVKSIKSEGRNPALPPIFLEQKQVFAWSLPPQVQWFSKAGKFLSSFEDIGHLRRRPAVLRNGTLVFGDDKGNVYWISNGKLLHKFNANGRVWAHLLLMPDQETVAIGYDPDSPTKPGMIYLVKNGKKGAQFEVPSGVTSLNFLSNGRMFVAGTGSGVIYWLKLY